MKIRKLNETLTKALNTTKINEEKSFETILVDDRYAIYPDGVIYDTEKAEDIPGYVFEIRDKIIGKSIEEDYEDEYELDPEQQEELNNAVKFYKEHGLLLLDTEEGKSAYETLYNAGYTMKKSGDVGHCIELNREMF